MSFIPGNELENKLNYWQNWIGWPNPNEVKIKPTPIIFALGTGLTREPFEYLAPISELLEFQDTNSNLIYYSIPPQKIN